MPPVDSTGSVSGSFASQAMQAGENTLSKAAGSVKSEVHTIGSSLDARIKSAREYVEQLCNVKARAEAMNLLEHPVDFFHSVLHL